MLKMLLRAPKQLFIYWMRHYQVQKHNSGAIITFPIVFEYDDVEAVKIGNNTLIGAFSEIAIVAKSPYNNGIPGGLVVENNVVIGSHANIRAAGGRIFIGRDSMLAQHVSLIAQNHTVAYGKIYRDLPWDESKTGVYIDENVWIGMGLLFWLVVLLVKTL